MQAECVVLVNGVGSADATEDAQRQLVMDMGRNAGRAHVALAR